MAETLALPAGPEAEQGQALVPVGNRHPVIIDGQLGGQDPNARVRPEVHVEASPVEAPADNLPVVYNPNAAGTYSMVSNGKDLVRRDGTVVSTAVERYQDTPDGKAVVPAGVPDADPRELFNARVINDETTTALPSGRTGTEQIALPSRHSGAEQPAITDGTDLRDPKPVGKATVPTSKAIGRAKVAPANTIERDTTPAETYIANPELMEKHEAAMERWTRLSAKHSGKLVGFTGEASTKNVKAAHEEYLDALKNLEDDFTAGAVARGVSPEDIATQIKAMRLSWNMGAAERRTEFRKQFAQEHIAKQEKSFLGKNFGKFVDWWGKQGGGGKFFSKQRIVGNLKKGAPMAIVGAAAGIAGATLLAPALATAGSTAAVIAATVATVRGLSRGVAGAALGNAAGRRDLKVADAQLAAEKAKIQEVHDAPGVASNHELSNVLNKSANKDRWRNFNRYTKGVATGIGAAALGYGLARGIGWAGGQLFGGEKGAAHMLAKPEDNATLRSTAPEAPRGPEAWSTTLQPGDGFERVFERYAATKGIDPNGAEVHRWFTNAVDSGLISKENVGKNITGGAPMNNIGNAANGYGGRYGYPGNPGDVTTLSPAMVSALNQEMAYDMAKDYARAHGLEDKFTDDQLRQMISSNKNTTDAIFSQPNITPAQIQANMDKVLTEAFDKSLDAQEAATRPAANRAV
jgi:hypothetical protein